MKILLLGATGRTGKLILQEALQQGHTVHSLVRDLSKVDQSLKNAHFFEGTPGILEDLERAWENCSLVISALNISRTSDFPWAKLRTPPTFLSDVMANILAIAANRPVDRIIVCSAWGVQETIRDIPWWFRWTIQGSNIKVAYQDHERQEDLLEGSPFNWTIVRPVGLTNFKGKDRILESFNNSPKPKLTISRVDVAKYMVDALSRPDLIGKKPVISTP